MTNTKFTATFNERPRRNTLERPIKGMKLFVTSNVDSVIDKCFDSDLCYCDFKSKAYTKVKNKGTKLVINAIRTHYGLDNNVAITFSHYCGCSSCPCSPGYDIKPRTDYGREMMRDKGLINVDTFAKIEFDQKHIDELTKHVDQFFIDFEAEKKQHEEVAA